uniref:Centromere protein X n=1 Tax=Aotus nancymaae TaxID=37293 RepID=A0A2K5CP00_AOTNA
MEGAGAGAGFRKELVSRLLHVHFKDDKTKVSGDALQLMAELLKIFVVGEPRARCPGFLLFFQRENQDTFSRFPQGPELGLRSLFQLQKQQSVGCGRPRQRMPFLWTWTSWRRCFRSCSWTSRDLSRG